MIQITVSPFVHIFEIISLFAIELEQPKIGIFGKGLMSHALTKRGLLHLRNALYQAKPSPGYRSIKPTLVKQPTVSGFRMVLFDM